MTLHAVVGVSGQTGGATARALLARGARVRAVVRDPARGQPWAARGAEVAVADLGDAASLAAAFAGADAAYVLNPPAYTMPDLFVRAEELARNILAAVRRSRVEHLVVLSSVGAHLPSGTGNIRTNRTFEQVLGALGGAVTFLRPAYFMENWAWVAPAAAGQGVLPSFLSPAGRAIPMASVADIGEVAAEAMLGLRAECRVVEIEGPRASSPEDAAAAFTEALGRPVSVAVVPEAEWPAALGGWRFSPRTIRSWVELFQAFNSGRIDFERKGSAPVTGRVPLRDAIGAVVRGTPGP
jgi:uncharacterized protein YbjT (DUF2867 family)